jgi:phosphatidate cytidylyltransferase
MNSLKQRIITGIILMTFAIAGLSGNAYSFIAFFGIVNVLCLWEYFDLVLNTSITASKKIRQAMGMLLGVLPFLSFSAYYLFDNVTIGHVGAVLFPMFTLIFVVELFLNADFPFANIGYMLTGLGYIGLPFALLLPIHFIYGNAPIIGMWLFVAAFDVAAYLVGSKIGKTPFGTTLGVVLYRIR